MNGEGDARAPFPRPECAWCGAPHASANPSVPCAQCGRIPSTQRPTPPQEPVQKQMRVQAYAPRNAPPHATASRLLCTCGYDLTGTTVGGSCPECGTRVADVLAPRDARVQGQALTAVVLACCALPLYCVCGPVGLPLSVIAVILGTLAIRNGGQSNSADRSLAVIALVLGAVGVVAGILWSILFLGLALFP